MYFFTCTAQADIYSLGITLHELVTYGKHPFENMDFSFEFNKAIVSGSPIDPITCKGTSPWQAMEEIIDACLTTTPDDRPKVKSFIIIHTLNK